MENRLGANLIPTEAWVLPRPSKSKYKGSYPLHFETKFWRLMGEPEKVLQPFGGRATLGDTIDLLPENNPTWVGDAHDLHWIEDSSYDLVLLDPPYSAELAKSLYNTPPPRYQSYVNEAVRVVKPGGLVSVYHVKQAPRPAGTRLVHRLVVLTRTWHAARIVMTFQKEANIQSTSTE